MLLPEDRLAAFWSHVDQSEGVDGCWHWTGARRRDGYGIFKVSGHNYAVHRLTLAMKLGRPIAAGAFALHACHKRSCCNPAHLREGSHADNMRDMVESGRVATGDKKRNAKFTVEDVLRIRELADAGHKTKAIIQHLCLRAGANAVSDIAARATWRHVPEARPGGRWGSHSHDDPCAGWGLMS